MHRSTQSLVTEAKSEREKEHAVLRALAAFQQRAAVPDSRQAGSMAGRSASGSSGGSWGSDQAKDITCCSLTSSHSGESCLPASLY
jgi:hypothetical protein